MQIACQHVFSGLFKTYLGSCCSVVLSSGSAKVPEICVFADLLGITRYFVCSIPSSTTQPISMYREPIDDKWQMCSC